MIQSVIIKFDDGSVATFNEMLYRLESGDLQE